MPQARESYPTAVRGKANYFPNQVRLPPKMDNIPTQLKQVPVRNETYPGHHIRATIEEKNKEQPKFTIGETPQVSQMSQTFSQQLQPQPQSQQQQLEQIPKTSTVASTGSTSKS